MEKYTKVSNPTEYAKVEEKDLLGFQRDDLPEGARPIYSKGAPVKVLIFKGKQASLLDPSGRHLLDFTQYMTLQDPKEVAEACLNLLRVKFNLGVDWILAPGQGTFVFDPNTGKSVFFCIEILQPETHILFGI